MKSAKMQRHILAFSIVAMTSLVLLAVSSPIENDETSEENELDDSESVEKTQAKTNVAIESSKKTQGLYRLYFLSLMEINKLKSKNSCL